MRKIIRSKMGYYIIIKFNSPRGHNNLNTHRPKYTSKYMSQKLIELKGAIDKSIITIEDFNTPHLITKTSSRQ